jgi:negative regulator of flagellin synthesis FlgM
MAKQPPIDKISTNRIKSAIANGSYPLDLDKIADALFDAYKEMKD